MESISAHLKAYREQHTTLGCKVTHMFGIPMIAVSIPMLLFNLKLGILLFVIGWILQFIGHYVFEKNNPVFFGNPLDPATYIVALVFCADEWRRFLSGKPLVERSL